MFKYQNNSSNLMEGICAKERKLIQTPCSPASHSNSDNLIIWCFLMLDLGLNTFKDFHSLTSIIYTGQSTGGEISESSLLKTYRQGLCHSPVLHYIFTCAFPVRELSKIKADLQDLQQILLWMTEAVCSLNKTWFPHQCKLQANLLSGQVEARNCWHSTYL